MKYRLTPYSILEYGGRKDSAGRPHQEDCLYPAEGKLSGRDRTFILCDGMGGHDAGEVASATVCGAMGSALPDGGDFSETEFRKALDSAFDALDGRDTHAAKKMGTTMAFLRLHDKGAFIAHIGDSRVYHIRPGETGKDTEILFETSDHSLVNELVKAGELTREQARSTGQKNVITRAMQPHLPRRPEADIHTVSDIRPGDYFYLCSDGMLEQPDMDGGASLRNIFSKEGGAPADKVKILRSVTERNKDNHSAFVIHIEDVFDRSTGRQKLPDRSTVGQKLPDRSTVGQEALDRSTVELNDKGRDTNRSVIIFCIAGLMAALVVLLWKFLR